MIINEIINSQRWNKRTNKQIIVDSIKRNGLDLELEMAIARKTGNVCQWSEMVSRWDKRHSSVLQATVMVLVTSSDLTTLDSPLTYYYYYYCYFASFWLTIYSNVIPTFIASYSIVDIFNKIHYQNYLSEFWMIWIDLFV